MKTKILRKLMSSRYSVFLLHGVNPSFLSTLLFLLMNLLGGCQRTKCFPQLCEAVSYSSYKSGMFIHARQVAYSNREVGLWPQQRSRDPKWSERRGHSPPRPPGCSSSLGLDISADLFVTRNKVIKIQMVLPGSSPKEWACCCYTTPVLRWKQHLLLE